MSDQIDVNALSNAIQVKADLDLGNLSYNGQEYIKSVFRTLLTGLLPPVRMTKYEDINSSTYVAPIDGFIRVRIGAVYNWEMYINGIIVQQQSRNSGDSCTTTWTTVPVKAGDTLTVGGDFYGGAMYYSY